MVLSSQRVDLKDALFNALKDKDKAETTNPLVVDGQKMIPSVTRVFSKAKDMYVFLQAYEATLETPRPVVASVAFYQGQNKVFETPMIQVTTPTTVNRAQQADGCASRCRWPISSPACTTAR